MVLPARAGKGSTSAGRRARPEMTSAGARQRDLVRRRRSSWSDCQGEGDGVAECFELADVVACLAGLVGAAGVVADAEVTVARVWSRIRRSLGRGHRWSCGRAVDDAIDDHAGSRRRPERVALSSGGSRRTPTARNGNAKRDCRPADVHACRPLRTVEQPSLSHPASPADIMTIQCPTDGQPNGEERRAYRRISHGRDRP